MSISYRQFCEAAHLVRGMFRESVDEWQRRHLLVWRSM